MKKEGKNKRFTYSRSLDMIWDSSECAYYDIIDLESILNNKPIIIKRRLDNEEANQAV